LSIFELLAIVVLLLLQIFVNNSFHPFFIEFSLLSQVPLMIQGRFWLTNCR
jgi:hypothetical protein